MTRGDAVVQREDAVVLRGVSVQLGSVLALDQVDIAIRRGERVALVGPSGAGKSTFLGLLNGSLVPFAGSVRALGKDFSTLSERALRAHRTRIATLYQQLHLVGNLRVVHNVNAGRLGSWGTALALRSLVRPVEVERAQRALGRLGLAHRHLERTDRLSGGEQQRVALARLLVAEPELILADEPISSLDPARAREVLTLLCDIASEADATLVVSLHAFDLAVELCDRVIGLRAGRVCFDVAGGDVRPELADELYRIEE